MKSLAQTLNGQLLHADPSESAGSVCMIAEPFKGNWFVCIRGERTMGIFIFSRHWSKGLRSRRSNRTDSGILLHTPFPQIRVADPNFGPREWASLARTGAGKVGITGSNLENLTKELLTRLCLIIDENTHATRGNQ